ncbi:allophanate hydrolase [Paraphaeosphaeria sporulosa]|uniref:Allophanate hydrolase n=1 Tax=Paraphaeosphaeria sporulosa TaxID=1460663 RepID=A0A177C1R6_9PLEO|nr:allophanate hydrolase [Paraphaeosphaeria sporulosa]OAG01386.1 allophanate hydrolase [Paraphaeosphaeria sporulosa]
MAIAVVGAHLRGFPLNKDLTCRGALFLQLTKTSANYRLFALQNTEPRKPGLRRAIAGESGRPIEVEVWRLPKAQFGEFMDTVKFPLGIGQVELQDHSWIHGFVCEYAALAGTLDITEFGGWRAYTNNLTLPASSGAFRTCD